MCKYRKQDLFLKSLFPEETFELDSLRSTTQKPHCVLVDLDVLPSCYEDKDMTRYEIKHDITNESRACFIRATDKAVFIPTRAHLKNKVLYVYKKEE